MIDDHPNFQGQGPASQKLVLPAPSEDPYQPGAYSQRVFVHPDQMRPPIPTTSTNPLSKLVALWQAEPAYKVLMIATVMVLIAGIIFATFLVNALAQPANTTPKAAIAPIATNIVPTTPPNTQPTFPTPFGGQGSNTKSSQPPKSAPVVLPTLAPSEQQPTQPPTNQNVQLQISDYQQQVRNNSDTQITVTANQPDVSVRLQVVFDQSFITNSAGPETTGADGTATLNWHVANVSFKQNFVARITAIATTQDGQQVSSQTITVDVSNRIRF